MEISAFAKEGGVGIETVRYYQRRGLLPVPAAAGRRRHYDQEAVRRLRFIRAAQTAGFTLTEIGDLLALDAEADRGRALEMSRKRLRAMDQQIASLQKSRAALQRLADRCSGGPDGPCPILEAFETA